MKNNNIKKLIEDELTYLFGVNSNDANSQHLYEACVSVVNKMLLKKRQEFNEKVTQQKGKRIYYLSMEFLMGRALKNSIYNLGLTDEFNEALKEIGANLEELYECEPDAGLGNGGLGRLAACYLDAFANLRYPVVGFSLRYEYGLFKQRINNCWQEEVADVWLPGGEVWLTKRRDKKFIVKFDGYLEESHIDGKTIYEHKGYNTVEAVPYDMIVNGNNDAISVLRLWHGENPLKFDYEAFSRGDYYNANREYNDAELLCKGLYPADNHEAGKELRIKQQYFLVSASVQNIIFDHMRNYGDIRSLPKYVAIHINDTHPALCIPELMRILMDDYNIQYDEAWDIVTKTVYYTNHTVLAEALERWSTDLIRRKLPRIYKILDQINERFWIAARTFGFNEYEIRNMGVIENGEVRMANLSVIASLKVNGVSKLHSEIIKNSIFNNFYKMTPEKFTNVTNGIAYRRWLLQSNPELVKLLDEKIGIGYKTDASKLNDLMNYYDDNDTLKRLAEIKFKNKCEFAKFIYRKQQEVIDPNSRFDVQVKRLHEYKRQLLNVLRIVALFIELEENPYKDVTPQTFIFGAKAAASYYVAKDVIKLICSISAEIKKRPEMKKKLNVIFVEDYNVSTAEKLMPASEISEQISLAGKEASGTGNMKFMINGALTLGTLDGANVEMAENVGMENIKIFGMKANEVEDKYKAGYNAYQYYQENPLIKKVLDRLDIGFNNSSFSNIKDYLLHKYPLADPYMCLADFDSYMNAANDLDEIYRDQIKWQKMALVNIAKAGYFSADRSISEYAKNIWNLKPIK